MAAGQSTNAYIGHLAQSLSSGGSESVFYVDKITTLTGEVVTTAAFSIFGKGTVTIDPLSTTNIEFASFTAVDGSAISFTGGVRGLSAFDYTASTSRAKYHPVGTTVIIAFGVHNLLDLVNYVAGQVAGTIGTATNLVTGSTKLSVAAVSPTIPIAVGDNDIRVSQYTVDTGTANTYVIAPSPAITSYVTGQKFSFKAINNSTGASTINVNSLGTKSLVKNGSVAINNGDIVSGQIYEVQYDGTNFQLLAGNYPQIKFGGTGADGALAITSGATNIDLGSAQVVVKNYTSISITGTGSLTFTNPHANGTIVVLKSQGAVTLTSSTAPMIDMSGIGAIGGTASSATASSSSAGNTATNGLSIGFLQTNAGTGGSTSTSAGGGASATIVVPVTSIQTGKYPQIYVGAGGGSGAVTAGATSTASSGVGGRGGGCLIIECSGALNFTTNSGISVAGKAGLDSSTSTGSNWMRGGGGGGGGGCCIILYNTLTASSGTITVSGGSGAGNSANYSGGSGTAGGGGGGGSTTTGSSGGNAGATNTSGGAGGAGYSLVALNTEFV